VGTHPRRKATRAQGDPARLAKSLESSKRGGEQVLKGKLATNELYMLLKEKAGLSREEADDLFLIKDEGNEWILRLRPGRCFEAATYRAVQRVREERGGSYETKHTPTWRIPKHKPKAVLKPEQADEAEAEAKKSEKPRLNHAKTSSLGVPNALKNVAHEKATVPVTAKLQPTLAEYVRKKGGSTFIRQVLLEKFAEETEGEAQEAQA